ncbi:SlpB [Lactobacillus crispatus]|uniref:SLAP domain-containing protein n=1 Tax=Lactobacillus crispatus TaxID=47770 RepID=UPI0018E39A69|nr:SLAP domain-containing protein [Lactobacillus crispatus]MBI1698769.1 SlpB [Lactobacillus crispatus]
MKKNLRIVSAAAAALLAVAPVAASAVSTVSAAANTQITLPANSNKDTKGTITLNSNVKAVTFPRKTITNNVTGQVTEDVWDGQLSGTVSASYKGQSYTVTLPAANGVQGIYYIVDNNGKKTYQPVHEDNGRYALKPGQAYYVYVKGASINMTTANANLTKEVLGSNGDITFFKGNESVNTLDVATNQNGGVYVSNDQGANLGTTFDMMVKVVPTDMTNSRSVSFFEKSTGNAVNSGSLDFTVGPNQTLNVNQILGSFKAKYEAHQLEGNTNSGASLTTTANDIKDQLTKEGMSVDANGDFTPNDNFSLSFGARSAANGATTTMTVTVNVKGGKVTTVPSQSKTVMHNAFYYDKNGKRVGSDKVTRYNSANVAMTTTTINGKAYYEVIESGKATGKFINAANIDGTKRTLKHNAYVYKSSKKRANKVVLKKGETVVTYGGAYTFKNGKQYYKIGNNTDKTYVKVANF